MAGKAWIVEEFVGGCTGFMATSRFKARPAAHRAAQKAKGRTRRVRALEDPTPDHERLEMWANHMASLVFADTGDRIEAGRARARAVARGLKAVPALFPEEDDCGGY